MSAKSIRGSSDEQLPVPSFGMLPGAPAVMTELSACSLVGSIVTVTVCRNHLTIGYVERMFWQEGESFMGWEIKGP
jgi:hypothetical protein